MNCDPWHMASSRTELETERHVYKFHSLDSPVQAAVCFDKFHFKKKALFYHKIFLIR